MEPSKSTTEAELCQVGCTRVQYFSSPAVPVPPGACLEPRRGRTERAQISAEESLKRMQAFATRKEKFVSSIKPEPAYHRLVVAADPKTVIWLIDDCWHPVQKAIGTLDISVLHGRYFIELGESGLNGVAYPIELFSDLRLTQDILEASPACQRQPPKLLDE